MNLHRIDVPVLRRPSLDPDFIPIVRFCESFLASAGKQTAVGLAAERSDGQIAHFTAYIHGTPEMADADCYYVDRMLKTLLWMKGGFRIHVAGSSMIFDYLKAAYTAGGSREFDAHFMSQVYERPFEVVQTDQLPPEKDMPQQIGGHTDGCRIGFDAGGSDRKVSAVMDGVTVFDEEVVWFPKLYADPVYHYDGIVSALKTAASHLPRVDAVGISSAGIYIANRTMRASLFNAVPEDLMESRVRDIYIRAVHDTFGDIPMIVANDGDVSALAGVMSLKENNVLGIAMGTSEAAGYVDAQGRITGWLNELAFVPVDCAPGAERDEWSGDIGCGVKYFSQDGVIKLAVRAGITLPEYLSPAEKLGVVQARMEEGDPAAAEIFENIGVYLGHTLAFYYSLYKMRHVLLLGRVMSGRGGDLILDTCRSVLDDEYPDVAEKILPALPDERFRRIGQSAAAAGLPALRG